jgi:hypothetical protein
MNRVTTIAAVAAALCGLSPRAARADEDPVDGAAMRHRLAAYGILGFGTPVGSYGVEGVVRVTPVFEISAGAGLGLSALMAHAGSPLQWALMPRLRVGRDERSTFTFGVGTSGGNIGDIPIFCDEYCDPPKASYPIHYWQWINVELGGEHWFRNGFALRYFVGAGHGWETATGGTFPVLPYTGVGLGKAF